MPDRPYNNSELFLEDFLDDEVPQLPEWDCDDAATDVYESLHELYENEYQDGYAENYDNEEDNLDKWIEEVLDRLGYDYLGETGLPGAPGSVDRVLFSTETARKDSVMPRASNDYETVYGNATTILEAKQWGADFDQKFSEDRNYFNAGNQIKYYLSHVPPESIEWGILTNGRHWRLYGTKDYQTHIFYEIDLINVLESDDLKEFKYFFCFFRPDAFTTTADGQSFLDGVYEESANAARDIGTDLQDNVFQALATLGEGFIDTNDLEIQHDGRIDPDSLNIDIPDEETFTLQDLKEQSLVLLYRLMFAFYAESRGLLQPDSAENQRTYRVELSILKLRDDIIECGDTPDTAANTYLSESTTQWARLDTFFRIIDQGKSSIGMTAYDGGLFDRGEHAFLNSHSISNKHLAKVIYLLSTTEQDGRYERVNYAGLGTRHLGSIYEGLLEHQFEVADEPRIAVKEDGFEEWKSASEVLNTDSDDTDDTSDTDDADDESLSDRIATAGVDAVDWVKEGDLYVVNDKGERKATGSFYTPDYVVEYIVRETVDPRIEDIHDALDSEDYERGTPEYAREFRNRVLDLTIVDPAMGSGHFLTETTTYLAQQIVEVVREADELVVEEVEGFGTVETRADGGDTTALTPADTDSMPDADSGNGNGNGESKFEENQIRRDIAKECIYGVDVNPMAVELAKLSMWLETLAANQPLAFLDHHLRTGNSLIGADIEAVDGIDAGEDLDDEQTDWSRWEERREDIIDDVMDLFGDLLEVPNETLDDAQEMKRIYYEDIQKNPKYRRLKQIANVHAAEQIELDWSRESAFEQHSGLPGGAYEYMAEVLEDDELWGGEPDEDDVTAVTDKSWFRAAQNLSDEERFFHWKVEFPEVFFDEDGEKLPDAGFDVMLGNPPYIPTEEIPDRQKTYLTTRFSDILHRKYDLSVPFLQQCYDHTHNGGYVGMITPVSWETGSNYEPFRSHNFGEDGDVGIQQVINLPFDVFEDAYVDTTICLFTSGEVPEEFRVKEFPKRYEIQNADEIGEGLEAIDYEHLRDDPATKVYVLGSIYDLMSKYGSDDYDTIGDVTDSTQGPVESHYDYSQTKEDDSQLLYRDLDVYRYSLSVTDERYIYMDEDDSDRDYYTTPRVLIRRLVSRDDRLMAMYETDDYVVKKDLNPFLRDSATESLQYLLAQLNSALHSYLYINQSSLALKDDFRQTTLTDLRELPYRSLDVDTDADHDPDLPNDIEDKIDDAVTTGSDTATDAILKKTDEKLDDDDDFVHDVIATLVERVIDTKALHSEINTHMLTYFGEDLRKENLDSPEDYTRLADLSEYQPPTKKSDLLTANTSDDGYETIEITGGSIEEAGLKLKLNVDIRAREHSDDDYDYHDDITAATFLNSDDDLDKLLRAFLPEVLDGVEYGYAEYRDYATGSRSTLEDRVKDIRLPDASDVSDDVARFLNRKEEAQRLSNEISRCDDLIDRIVYQLYDLSNEQITQVEERLKSDG
ncbi:Eco57I restriction-modification methylase domain-containing protein [Haloarcula marismortui]|uniref:site-specific DNA-methyltransferase (adenine-specific) n=1 Tax=Haloarcula marismortui ATCC 33799 TaxID=662475 RepID=M0L092_9EURY|nr:TaqI-like C-terminal specificity domain-containing protein [Haloarcula californiae]EMA25430.1 putative restriction/modification enzyme [Haloarcula californiae ATCC 33799]